MTQGWILLLFIILILPVVVIYSNMYASAIVLFVFKDQPKQVSLIHGDMSSI